MTDNNAIIINNEDSFELSKFSIQDNLIGYDGKYSFIGVFDTRDSSLHNNGDLVITKICRNYINFVNILRKYCYKYEKTPEICSELFQHDKFNDKYQNALISIEFQIKFDVGIPLISYEVNNHEILIGDLTKDYKRLDKLGKYMNNVNFVKYLHQEIGVTKQDFQSNDNYACLCACSNGQIDVVKYLHQNIGLTKQDFQSDDNYACRWACENGHIDVVKYLHKAIKLTIQDFRSYDNYACRWACGNNHVDVVKYLHQEIGLTKQDFQSNKNEACRYACEGGNIDIVKYLHQEIKLTRQDFQSNNNHAYKQAVKNAHVKVIKYFNEEIMEQFEITKIHITSKLYTITTNDLVNKYPELKSIANNDILYNHIDGNIEYIDIDLNLESDKFSFETNKSKTICSFELEKSNIDRIKKQITTFGDDLLFKNIEFTYLENNEYKYYDKKTHLTFYQKLDDNEIITMKIRIYSNHECKMIKLF